jgi:signal transduction histidine kinase
LLLGLHEEVEVSEDGRLVATPERARRQTWHPDYRVIEFPALEPHRSGSEIVLTVRTKKAAKPWVRLMRVVLAPDGALDDWRSAYDRRQRDGARLALAVIFALMIVLAPMLARRVDAVGLWYAVALVGAAAYVAQFASPVLPFGIDLETRTRLVHTALIVATWATLRFSTAMSETGPPPRWLEFLLGGALATQLLIMTTTLPPALHSVLRLSWRMVLLAAIGWLAWHWWQVRRLPQLPRGQWFAGAAALLIVLGAHDTLRYAAPGGLTSAAYLLHWGILYLVSLMLAALLSRVLVVLDVAETAGERLSIALAERTRELEAEYARRRAAEAEAMIANERHRLMRDMHDGVGGQIVALIAQAERRALDPDALAGQLRRSLDDLRLVIDSLDSACADLGVALGMLRGRLAPLLTGLPVEVRWRTAHLPDLPPAPPGTVLGVLRIVQEALTNAIRHAAARTIDVGADWDGSRLAITVVDDGIGFDRGTVTAGRGLASLAHRAMAIGGVMDLDSRPGAGTRLTLRVPLGPASAEVGPCQPQ